MTILEVVRPIIMRTYGDSEYSRALSERIAGRIASNGSEGREVMAALICWDWYSGGGTATLAARQIEAELVKAGL